MHAVPLDALISPSTLDHDAHARLGAELRNEVGAFLPRD